MKLSTSILPILAVSAKKRQKKKDGDRTVEGERFAASAYTRQCSNQVPSKDGIFTTTNNGFEGEIKLENYPNFVRCKHVVQADSSCEAIRVSYRSIAVEPEDDNCEFDSFRFGWAGADGWNVTPPRCSCFGDGCTNSGFGGGAFEDYFGSYDDLIAGTDGFSVNSNTFTFYFRADLSVNRGHVILDWECIEGDVTTQQPGTEAADTTTTRETTTTATSTTTGTTTTTEPYEPTSTTTTEYYPDYASTTTTETTSTTTTEYTTTSVEATAGPYDGQSCRVKLVKSDEVCSCAGGSCGYKNDYVAAKYPRLATVDEAKAQRHRWQNQMGTWYIVSIFKGKADGPGYGSNIFSIPGTEHAWTEPPCHMYGAHLMCVDLDAVEELTTTSATTTSTVWESTTSVYYDYFTTEWSTTTEYT